MYIYINMSAILTSNKFTIANTLNIAQMLLIMNIHSRKVIFNHYYESPFLSDAIRDLPKQ